MVCTTIKNTTHGVCLLLFCHLGDASAAERYSALFEDGARVVASELKDWNDPQAQPRIADRLLFDAGKPMRWVIDRQQWNAAPPMQFVEFVGGDCLSGEVVGYQTGREVPFEQWPPHLVVRSRSELQPPDDPEPGVVRVALDAICRVVWEHRPTEAYRPNTAFLRHGGEIAFRSLRWTPAGVVLLVEDGVKELSFADLAEVHLVGVPTLAGETPAKAGTPTREPWIGYLNELAVLAPASRSYRSDRDARIVQWDAIDGGRFTASTVRFQARHWGDKNRPEAWLHLIQPAWSLDPLWLRFRTIHTWRSWAPHEPPLGRFGPVDVRRESVFGQGWQWRVDRNTQGQRLMIGATEFGGGFGVHATTDLVFDWPEFAREVRLTAGLDPAAGARGCVNLSVIGTNGKVLFQRDQLVGSKELVETNWLPVPHHETAQEPAAPMSTVQEPAAPARESGLAGAAGSSTLTLRADMAATNHPTGADPFDIRDIVNWADPQVRLDLRKVEGLGLRAESQTSATAASDSQPSTFNSQPFLAGVPGLIGWTALASDVASLRTLALCDVTDPRDPRFRTLFRTTDPFVVFSRSLKVGPQDEWLSLVVSRFSEHAPSSVQLKIDGVSCGEFDVPLRQGPIDPDPVLVPVAHHRGKTVQLEVVCYPTADNSWLDWRGVALTALRPGVRRLYEDDLVSFPTEPAAPARESALAGAAGSRTEIGAAGSRTASSALLAAPTSIANEPPFTGTACLRLAPGGPVEFPEIPGGEAIVTELPKLGQFRYIAFAWRGDNTSGLSLQLAHDGRFGARIADALNGRPVNRMSSRGLRSRRLDDRGLRYGYAYDTGAYQPASGSPLRLNRDVSPQWKLEARDLFGDFGPMTLTGFALQCHERGAGWFDHIYLTRTPQDLDFVKTYLLPTSPPAQDATYSLKATKPDEWGPAIAAFAPAFAAREASHGILQKREHFGQSDGWQTHPQDKDKPFVLRTGLQLPADRAQELDLRVSHQPNCDWRLVVRVNGKRIFEKLIDDSLTRPQRGWASVQVDLSAYRGQKVLLEVLNESNDWNNEHAVWKRVVLQDAT